MPLAEFRFVIVDEFVDNMCATAIASAIKEAPHFSGYIIGLQAGSGDEDENKNTSDIFSDGDVDAVLLKPVDIDVLGGLLVERAEEKSLMSMFF